MAGTSWLPARDITALAGIFTVSGVIHLVKPEAYEPIMPDYVPAHREVILGSGVAELACAAGLLNPGTRSAAGVASLLLLLGVYPANVQMALDARRSERTGLRAIAYGRLPLQLPMLWSAVRAARSGR